MSRAEKLDLESAEVLQRAVALAEERGDQERAPEHVLLALLEQEDGVAAPLSKKIGADPVQLAGELDERLGALPKVSGAGYEVGLGRRARDFFASAQKEADALKDDYVSAEHFLIASTRDRELGPVLSRRGLTHESILAALAEVRGSQRITDPEPEGKFNALEKYCRDLTEQARKGKLDPVIGRDEEIRRVMQVLSRRTK